ncbi:MAG: hypothetical protein KAH20_15880 [Methylococcales bacterium]|nr:hypothetical protein [Methylococcales bacterium]
MVISRSIFSTSLILWVAIVTPSFVSASNIINDSQQFNDINKTRHNGNPLTFPTTGNKTDNLSKFDSILYSLAQFLLPTAAHASAGQFENINLDGNLSDWSIDDRINLPQDRPPSIAIGNEIYGKYVASPTPTYLFALKSTGPALSANTTLWLNTDLNVATGHLVMGQYGGAEFFININSDDSKPNLYNKDLGWVSSLIHAYSSDRRTLEIAVPATSLQLGASAQSINILGDINDTTILAPLDYPSGGQFTLVGSHPSLPPRTDSSKRVAIVYGDTTKNNFFGKKAYSQLFMSVQHQAMMAGVSYDLLSENDLTDINNLVNYDALIFPFLSDIPSDKLKQIHDTLFKAVYNYGIGIITADDWLTNTETGASISGDAYRNMKQLLGIGRITGNGPVNINLSAQNTSHPAMKDYTSNELIKSYKNSWFSYFQSVPGQPSDSLVKQSVTGPTSGSYPAVVATTTGGRNVHFATLSYMADTNLLWQAIQWVLYGNEPSVGLKMGRTNNLFVSRNDMDISSEHDQVSIVHVPLLNLLTTWKNDYNFVGSFFINIGNDPANGFWTDWNVSAPLFSDYIKLDNEIGTHSWTHPDVTDTLSSSDIEFEFNQSMNKIGTQLNHSTWRNQNIRGAAVPGAPENFDTASKIIKHVDYLTGGYSAAGAGYPNAFGYLTPSSQKVYLSPNMSFDFTLIQFGIPVGNPPVPKPLNATEAEQFWKNEFNSLINHASLPIIHWPWHDYGPTMSADPVTGDGYSVDMFKNTIALAYNSGSEFVTSADIAQRINTFKKSKLTVDSSGSSITATVNATQLGKFSLHVNKTPGQVIKSVDNWYAYDDKHVFLDQNGGTYNIQLGSSTDLLSHITKLPMRSKLINLSGDGTNLNFTFEGEGKVRVALNQNPSNFLITGADNVTNLLHNNVSLFFHNFGTHTVTITR